MRISPLSAGSGSSCFSCMCSGAFIAEEVSGVREKDIGNVTVLDVQTL